MTLTYFAAITTFALSMSMSPGPNNLMVAASGANFGFQRTVPHMLGICVGFPVMLAMVGIGLGEVLVALSGVQKVMHLLGSGYLLYLAYRIANAQPSQDPSSTPKPLTFLQAALFQWVNPKAWVMALSTIATFTTTGADSSMQIGAMSLVFFGVALPSVAIWTLFGRVLSRQLKSRGKLDRFNKGMAFLLVLSVALNFM